MLERGLDLLRRAKAGTEELNYGRDIVVDWAASHCDRLPGPGSVLDIGLGRGDDLINIRDACRTPPELFGIECHPANIEQALGRGIQVASLDLEREELPFEDGSFDVVVANQILEHTKEIFFIVSELARVTTEGGTLIIGVPNLASLHNRVALAAGLQPPAIRVLGPHVRGFTRNGLAEFVEAGTAFALSEVRGANFYPFPSPISRWLARLIPSLAVGSFYQLHRTRAVDRFPELLSELDLETPYFRGSSGPVATERGSSEANTASHGG